MTHIKDIISLTVYYSDGKAETFKKVYKFGVFYDPCFMRYELRFDYAVLFGLKSKVLNSDTVVTYEIKQCGSFVE